ncbi:polysaccharide biosynthesis protein [Nitrobacter sp. TKz-YC01]|uniref:polysaccharide biosynthesis protein n=1 Tax=Nitrobacter sp. TKz-YC01 TaxID=3398703 RepID=UPI003A1000A9
MTDAAMPRFWISPQESVDFVLKCFQRMRGGEIFFLLNLPSIRIVDPFLCSVDQIGEFGERTRT